MIYGSKMLYYGDLNKLLKVSFCSQNLFSMFTLKSFQFYKFNFLTEKNFASWKC